MAFEVYYSFLHKNEDPFKADHYKIYRQSVTGVKSGAYSQIDTLYPSGVGDPIAVTGMDIVPNCSVHYNYKVSAYNTQGEIFCINPVLSGINFPCPTPSPSATASPSKTPSPTISVSVTPSLTATPTVTPSPQYSPSPTPTISVTATVTATATPSSSSPAGSPSPTPTATTSISVSPTVTPSLSVSPTVTPSLSVSPTVTPSLSVSPTVTPSLSVSPTVTPSLSVSPTVTPSLSVSPSPSPSKQPPVNIQFDSNTYVLCNPNDAQVTWNGYHNIQEVTAAGYNSYSSSEHIGSAIKGYENNGHVELIAGLGAAPGETRYFVCATHPSSKFKTTCAAIPSPTPTPTASSTTTPSVSPSHSVTPTSTPSVSATPTATPSVTISPTVSPTATISPTVSPTVTPSASVSPTVTPSASVSPTATPSVSVSPTATPSASITQTPTPSVTVSPTASPSSPAESPSPTPTTSASVTQTPTPSVSVSPTATPSASITQTPTPSVSVSPTATPSASITQTPTPSVTQTPTPSVTQTPTPSLTQTPTPTPSSSAPSAGGGGGTRSCWEFFELTSNTVTAGNHAIKVNSTNFSAGSSDLAWPAGATGFEIEGVPFATNLQSGQGIAYYWGGPYDNVELSNASDLYSKIPNYVNVASVDPDDSSTYGTSATPSTDGPHLYDFGLYKCLNASCTNKEEASVLAKDSNNNPITLKIQFATDHIGSSYQEMPAGTIIKFSGRFLPC